jgi:hypothetical protein
MPGVYLCTTSEKDFQFQENLGEDYQVLKKLGFKPGMSKFYQNILGNKGDGLGAFNLAVYWQRKYRKPGAKEPWYILTNLPNLKLTLDVYCCRWGIEQMFKDYKSGGYNARRYQGQ